MAMRKAKGNYGDSFMLVVNLKPSASFAELCFPSPVRARGKRAASDGLRPLTGLKARKRSMQEVEGGERRGAGAVMALIKSFEHKSMDRNSIHDAIDARIVLGFHVRDLLRSASIGGSAVIVSVSALDL